MSLNFDISSCVRATSKSSQCTKCEDVCPVSTIQIIDNIPAFTPADCIECGGCVGVCPTDAFSLGGFSNIDFFFSFLESKQDELTCKKDLPCLSVLSVEELISLALASEKDIKLNALTCRCGGDSDKLTNIIEQNIEEANYILSSFSSKKLISQGSSEIIEPAQEEKLLQRREFFSLKSAVKTKHSFDEAVSSDELKEFALDTDTIDKMKQKIVPDKRKLLYSLLKRTDKPESYEVLASDDVSFISQKVVDDSCTNCQICYRVCPSGALSSNGRFSLINFDAMLCLKCNLCHDVCESDSIKITEGFNVKEFFEPSKKQLIKFDVRRCNECGNNFTYLGGEVACNRCQLEESEALSLQGY